MMALASNNLQLKHYESYCHLKIIPKVKQIHFTLAVWWVAKDQILFNHNGLIKGLWNR